jgi:adenine specific DNA methylase Mod
VRQALSEDSARHTFQQHNIELGSSELQTVSTYKPGGTTIITQEDATGRITSQDSDKYGRWSYLHLQGKDDKTITYITAYQVCAKPTTLQGITAYHQQEIACKREKRTKTNPRHNFRNGLIQFIKIQQDRGHSIILAGDFNEHIQKPTTPAYNKSANSVSCSTFGNKNSLISQNPPRI